MPALKYVFSERDDTDGKPLNRPVRSLMASPPSYVRAQVTSDKGFLLHHYLRANKYDHPGGRIEAGETPIQAMVRELRERIGMEPYRDTDMEDLGPNGEFHNFRVPSRMLRLVAKPGELGGYSTDIIYGQPRKAAASLGQLAAQLNQQKK